MNITAEAADMFAALSRAHRVEILRAVAVAGRDGIRPGDLDRRVRLGEERLRNNARALVKVDLIAQAGPEFGRRYVVTDRGRRVCYLVWGLVK